MFFTTALLRWQLPGGCSKAKPATCIHARQWWVAPTLLFLFNKVTAAERIVRIAAGVILMLIGLDYTAKYIFYFDLF